MGLPPASLSIALSVVSGECGGSLLRLQSRRAVGVFKALAFALVCTPEAAVSPVAGIGASVLQAAGTVRTTSRKFAPGLARPNMVRRSGDPASRHQPEQLTLGHA